ncbi:MAG TPA: hypothetical protein VFU71_07925, partial [Burkholderiaceae bacterium]|nr:hypothetical protein [Burkholderiaceae bacterium]
MNAFEPAHTGGTAVSQQRRIVSVVLAYAVFAALWIYGSDLALSWLIADPDLRGELGLYKGWGFVAVTSILLYALLRRMLARSLSAALATDGAASGPKPSLALELSVLAALVIGLTALAVLANFRLERGREVARLEAVSDLRAKQIDDWLSDRMSEALFLRNSEYLSSAYLQWQDQRDRTAGTRLLERMSEFTQSNHYHGWLLLDAAAQPVATET